MSAHFHGQPLRSPMHRAQLGSIREAIETMEARDPRAPLLPLLREIEALAGDPLALDSLETTIVSEAMTLAAGYADEWASQAPERAWGASVDAAMHGAAP